MTLAVAPPPHVSRVLEALAARDIAPSQNGDPTAWHGRCPACDGELVIRDVIWNERSGERKVLLSCAAHADDRAILQALGLRERDLFLGARDDPTAAVAVDATIVSLGEFVAVDEPGAAPLLGDDRGALIPEGGDMMVYGDGGAGKTTLLFDLAFHLASGTDWLGIPVARPTRVLLIENEGPRPLLRQKLRRKLEAWSGRAADGRISVFEEPWAKFTFADTEWRNHLAQRIAEHEVDVLIAGPLTRLGMDSAGTLHEVVEFMRQVAELRDQCGRLLTVILVHHENKAGAVSGAWEGAGDTLLHVEAAGNGHTVVYIQKARWASSYHHTHLKLAWTDGESFAVEGDRDYVAEIRELLDDDTWLTERELAKPRPTGIGAGPAAIKTALNSRLELFEMRTGDAAVALGRQANAKLWGVRSAFNAHDAEGALQGGAEGMSASASALKGRRHASTPHTDDDGTASTAQRTALGEGWTDDQLQAIVDAEEGGS